MLPGLRQIEAGQFDGQPEPDTHESDVLTAWLRGDRSARIPGSITGDEFDPRFDEAVQTIYDSGDLNPLAFLLERQEPLHSFIILVLCNGGPVLECDNMLYHRARLR